MPVISKMHSNDQTFVKIKVYIIQFIPYSAYPADKCMGGSAVIVKENIKHYEESKYVTKV